MYFRKRVFFLTGATLTVYQGRRCPTPSPVFQDNPAGLRAFADYLDSAPRTPVCLLIDLVEEEFRTGTIPHVFGPDRRALVANRQNRWFRHTPYRCARFQGRETAGRRDDRVLFAAVGRPDGLGRWLGPMTERKIPLVGIYSLPMVSGRLLPTLRAIVHQGAAAAVLSVHCNADGGLRQSLFLGGHLKASRLATPPGSASEPGVEAGVDAKEPDNAAGSAAWILGEVEKTRHYLGDLGLLSGDRPLDVYLLSASETLAALERASAAHDRFRYHFVDLAKIGAKTGVGTASGTGPSGPHADALFAGALMRGTLANHYATRNEIRDFRVPRIRGALYATGVVMLSASLAWSASRFSEQSLLREQTAVLARQAHMDDDRGARGAPDPPETPADGPSLKAAVETAALLEASKTTPYPLFVALGTVLDGESAVEIRAIEWSVAAEPPPVAHAPGGGGIESHRSRLPPRSPSGPPPTPGQKGLAPYQVALIEGRLAVSAKDAGGDSGGEARPDYRKGMGLVEDFASKLSRLHGMVRVEIVRRPFGLGSGEALRGKANGVLEAENFVLRIVYLRGGSKEGV
uniref:Uncharacterized protein n=1 Tax=Candidatus Kentrum eta TaxID=2126337 RepID=A0A450UDX5_9GAMM|nr:MAG: hypothetical protein BECKH772A_GA0070896_1000922 [Candidatus Kentron sp. H]VFJ90589.1 MAG: hypothetical protein BECKH772B_GA0070898_1001022 [Candidatus Kentron sp. H]VFJ96730.1 MAG: hypothetical protein BECKH772C_GA0070978_1000822 [Candidatus Kentron sp. H]